LPADFEYSVSQMTAPLFPPGKMMAAPSGCVAADSGLCPLRVCAASQPNSF